MYAYHSPLSRMLRLENNDGEFDFEYLHILYYMYVCKDTILITSILIALC